MDEEVQLNIHNPMEIQDQDLSRDSKTDQTADNQVEYISYKATDTPMNHGDGDGIAVLEELPGPSSKTKPKRSRKRTHIVAILRESLHREAKSLAMQKLRIAIKDRKNNLIGKTKTKRSRKFRKRKIPKKRKEVKGKRNAREKKRNKVTQPQRELRLSPVSCNSVECLCCGGPARASKGSTESGDSESTGSGSF